jgi:hypothetical protein
MTGQERRDLTARSRSLMHRYPGFTLGAVIQASILTGIMTATADEMQEIASALDNEEYQRGIEETKAAQMMGPAGSPEREAAYLRMEAADRVN